MSKDLTNSATDRQNILNNPYALAEIEKAAGRYEVVTGNRLKSFHLAIQSLGDPETSFGITAK